MVSVCVCSVYAIACVRVFGEGGGGGGGVILQKTGQNCDTEGKNLKCEIFNVIIWKMKA